MANNIQTLSNEQLLLARIFNVHTVTEIATEQNRRAIGAKPNFPLHLRRRPLITAAVAKRAMRFIRTGCAA